MTVTQQLVLIAALVAFVLAAIGVTVRRVNLTAAGLAFLTLYILLVGGILL